MPKSLSISAITVGWFAVAGAGTAFWQTPVKAQSWYPQACVAIDYCAPVKKMAWVARNHEAAPQLTVSSKYGQAVVQNAFTVQNSQDGNTHVCMRYDPFGTLEVTCLLVPSSGF